MEAQNSHFKNSVVHIDEKNNREVEVFTPASEGKDYTGVEVVTVKTGRWVAEIGCWFKKNRLEDYDGVFALSPWVIKALRKAGYTVPRDFEVD